MILGRSIARNAMLHPERAAAIEEHGAAIDHRTFADRVWRLVDGLAKQGLKKGDRIGLLSRNCIDFLCCYYGIGSLGAWMVPLNHALKPSDLDARMGHAEVDALIVGPEFAEIVSEFSAETRARLRDRVFVIGAAHAQFIPLDEIIASGRPRLPDVHISPDDTLYIGYTSGTTGAPKGAMVPHRAIVIGFLYKALAYSLSDRDISINAGPYWHSAPLDFASLAIYLGGTAIIPDGFDADRFLALVERHRATNSFVVPTMLQMITASPTLATRDLSSWRCIVSGGAPLPSQVKNIVLERLGPVLQEFYGATESRSIAYITPAELATRERSVGRPNRDVEIRVLDPSGADAPIGSVGEIYVRGPGVFNGYFKDPERTRAAFRGDWFSLGDLGRLDAEGYLYLVDRKNDMIITGGENVYPNDVEEVLRRVPGVKDAAVVGVPDQKWGEVVAAFIQVDADTAIDHEQVTSYCGLHLPNYMKPRHIEFVSSLPRNPMGKVLRRVLREPFWRDHSAQI